LKFDRDGYDIPQFHLIGTSLDPLAVFAFRETFPKYF
jgi:hypothetical protein